MIIIIIRIRTGLIHGGVFIDVLFVCLFIYLFFSFRKKPWEASKHGNILFATCKTHKPSADRREIRYRVRIFPISLSLSHTWRIHRWQSSRFVRSRKREKKRLAFTDENSPGNPRGRSDDWKCSLRAWRLLRKKLLFDSTDHDNIGHCFLFGILKTNVTFRPNLA